MLNYVDTFAQMLRAAGGQDLFGHVGKGKMQRRRLRRPGDNCPSAGAYGMRPYGAMGFYLIIYTYKKHPARQRGAAGGVARVLIYFRSDP